MERLYCQRARKTAEITNLHELDPHAVSEQHAILVNQRCVTTCRIHPLVKGTRPPIRPFMSGGKVTGCERLPVDPKDAETDI